MSSGVRIDGVLYGIHGYATSGVLVCGTRTVGTQTTVVIADEAVYYVDGKLPPFIDSLTLPVGGGMTALITDMIYDWDNNLWTIGGEHVRCNAVYYAPAMTYTFFSISKDTDTIFIRNVRRNT